MKLWFKQRFFSWLDSYDIYYEDGSLAYTVKGQLSWGHRLQIYDPQGRHLGTVQQKVLTFLPKFILEQNGEEIGTLQRSFSLFHPHYELDLNNWSVDGNWLEWDYEITGPRGTAARISKQLFHLTDTYEIEVFDPRDALAALMVVLAIDAEKCSRN